MIRAMKEAILKHLANATGQRQTNGTPKESHFWVFFSNLTDQHRITLRRGLKSLTTQSRTTDLASPNDPLSHILLIC